MSLKDYCRWWDTQRPGAADGPRGARGRQLHELSQAERPEGVDGGDQQQQQQQQQRQQQRLGRPALAGGAQEAPRRQLAGRPAGADGRLLYLKDWHYVAECPMAKAYRLPPFFREDWLNAHCDDMAAAAAAAAEAAAADPGSATCAAAAGGGACGHPPRDTAGRGAGDADGGAGDGERGGSGGGGNGHTAATPCTADYRFVYCGPAGSWTPLHADVLRSFSWSCNVAGSKRWLLLAPEHAHLLRHRRRAGVLAPDFFIDDLIGGGLGGGCGGCGGDDVMEEEEEPLDPDDYPGLAAAQKLLYEVIQGPGDALFVPSGWHHTVVNLTDCISINHNWLNAHNAHWSWAMLEREHRLATASLEDCRETCETGEEFETLVQRALAANAGMDFEGWGALLARAARAALSRLGPGSCGAAVGNCGGGGVEGGGGGREGDGEGGCKAGAGQDHSSHLQALLELWRAALLLRALLSSAARAAARNAAAAAVLGSSARRPAGSLRAGIAELAAGPREAAGGCGRGGSAAGAPVVELPAPATWPPRALLAGAGGGELVLAPLGEDEEAALPAWGRGAAALLSDALQALSASGPG